ncbi:MarR family winged helix-turn-helix transcriptional regulator [Paenibacillus rigui]|uniref:MarR family transcriptional regulator n=1 Tax=Paenibacillus rigui TaxID=554312 RepID=A0A229UPQ4_9BACL|nr:MarR family transcriptional regulator [Paenibacillus rigui]OXM85261.1 MarR family transcriptional regulator [Paenibacillus rigui]
MDTRHVYEEALGRIINHTSLVLARNFQKSLEPFDITLEQWGLLNVLWVQDGLTLKDLSDKVNKDHTNLSRIVDKLVKKGLLERTAHPEDRRAWLLYVTGKGIELQEAIVPVAEQVIEQEVQGISLEEQELLRRLLRRMCHNVQA